MALSGKSILVVGGGIAGLTIARALALRGAQVRLQETAPELTEVGAGIQITPNGGAVLRALGLWDAAEAAGLRATKARLNDGPSGKPIISMNLDKAHWLLMARPALIDVLEKGAREAGVGISLGSPWDGDTGADIVIGADGVHSRVARFLNATGEVGFSGQVAWRAVIPGDGDPVADVFMGPGRHLVSYPLKDGRRNIVAVEERDVWAADGWNHEDNPAVLRLAFEGFGGPVQDWLKAVDKVWLWGLMNYSVAKRWHDGKMVILGDAAHPTLPFLAQGANMALEDAWVLAKALDEHEPAEAMARYEAIRRPRVTRVLTAADRNGANYHMSNPVMRRVAHNVLKLGEAVRPGSALKHYRWLWGHDVTAD